MIARRKPRKMFVQPNLLYSEMEGKVVLQEYSASAMGIVQSFVARYRLEEMEEVLDQADKEAKHHQYFSVEAHVFYKCCTLYVLNMICCSYFVFKIKIFFFFFLINNS